MIFFPDRKNKQKRPHYKHSITTQNSVHSDSGTCDMFYTTI